MTNPDATEPKQETKTLTPEYLKTLNTLEVKVEGNFGDVLSKFNADRGLNLQSRPEGFHLTIIGPAENKVLSTLNPKQLEELQRLSDDIQHGIGTEAQGLGFIDGSQREDARSADKAKKVLFMAFDLPAIQAFRASLGLRPKDLHATLGFEGGDIHMSKTGVDAKGKDILRPIQKTAEASLNPYAEQIQNITFGGLGGQEKEQPKN